MFGASIVDAVLGDLKPKVQCEKDLIMLSSRNKIMRSRLRGKLESMAPGVIGCLLPDWDVLLCRAEPGPCEQVTGGKSRMSDGIRQG
jgi:hypothetical protein